MHFSNTTFYSFIPYHQGQHCACCAYCYVSSIDTVYTLVTYKGYCHNDHSELEQVDRQLVSTDGYQSTSYRWSTSWYSLDYSRWHTQLWLWLNLTVDKQCRPVNRLRIVLIPMCTSAINNTTMSWGRELVSIVLSDWNLAESLCQKIRLNPQLADYQPISPLATWDRGDTGH